MSAVALKKWRGVREQDRKGNSVKEQEREQGQGAFKKLILHFRGSQTLPSPSYSCQTIGLPPTPRVLINALSLRQFFALSITKFTLPRSNFELKTYLNKPDRTLLTHHPSVLLSQIKSAYNEYKKQYPQKLMQYWLTPPAPTHHHTSCIPFARTPSPLWSINCFECSLREQEISDKGGRNKKQGSNDHWCLTKMEQQDFA